MPYRVPHPSTEDEYPLTERAMGRGKGVRESFYYNDYKARATWSLVHPPAIRYGYPSKTPFSPCINLFFPHIASYFTPLAASNQSNHPQHGVFTLPSQLVWKATSPPPPVASSPKSGSPSTVFPASPSFYPVLPYIKTGMLPLQTLQWNFQSDSSRNLSCVKARARSAARQSSSQQSMGLLSSVCVHIQGLPPAA